MQRIIEWKRCNFVSMRSEQYAITRHIHLLFIYSFVVHIYIRITVIHAGRKAQSRNRKTLFSLCYKIL